jgi:5-methylcytosine-specific restriction endonuclease McrA
MSAYPPHWKQIAHRIKTEAEWKCIRCGHANDRTTGHVLTVHHLDGDKANCRWSNLVALCQRCHLSIQGKVIMKQVWAWEHADWFKPYAAAWYAIKYLGQRLTREQVDARMDELLSLERIA